MKIKIGHFLGHLLKLTEYIFLELCQVYFLICNKEIVVERLRGVVYIKQCYRTFSKRCGIVLTTSCTEKAKVSKEIKQGSLLYKEREFSLFLYTIMKR